MKILKIVSLLLTTSTLFASVSLRQLPQRIMQTRGLHTSGTKNFGMLEIREGFEGFLNGLNPFSKSRNSYVPKSEEILQLPSGKQPLLLTEGVGGNGLVPYKGRSSELVAPSREFVLGESEQSVQGSKGLGFVRVGKSYVPKSEEILQLPSSKQPLLLEGGKIADILGSEKVLAKEFSKQESILVKASEKQAKKMEAAANKELAQQETEIIRRLADSKYNGYAGKNNQVKQVELAWRKFGKKEFDRITKEVAAKEMLAKQLIEKELAEEIAGTQAQGRISSTHSGDLLAGLEAEIMAKLVEKPYDVPKLKLEVNNQPSTKLEKLKQLLFKNRLAVALGLGGAGSAAAYLHEKNKRKQTIQELEDAKRKALIGLIAEPEKIATTQDEIYPPVEQDPFESNPLTSDSNPFVRDADSSYGARESQSSGSGNGIYKKSSRAKISSGQYGNDYTASGSSADVRWLFAMIKKIIMKLYTGASSSVEAAVEYIKSLIF